MANKIMEKVYAEMVEQGLFFAELGKAGWAWNYYGVQNEVRTAWVTDEADNAKACAGNDRIREIAEWA